MKKIVIILLVLGMSSLAQGEVYTDDTGNLTYINGIPKRIVSLSPATTEILFAVGLEMEIVGVTQSCDFPEEAQSKTKIGNQDNPDFEKIVSLKPDLIISLSNERQKEFIDKIKKTGVPVLVIIPHDFIDVFKDILLIGQITGKLEEAGNVIVDMQKRKVRIESLTARSEKVRVFVQTASNPLTTVGKNSFCNHLISLARGENIVHNEKTKYPQYKKDDVLKKNPEVIIIANKIQHNKPDEFLKAWAQWQSTPAVKNKRIFTVDPALINRPGPRLIDGLEELAQLLHPELF